MHRETFGYNTFQIYVAGELVSECCMPSSVGANVAYYKNERVVVRTEDEGLILWVSDLDIYHISADYVGKVIAGRYKETTGKTWCWIDEEWLKEKAYKEKSHG